MSRLSPSNLGGVILRTLALLTVVVAVTALHASSGLSESGNQMMWMPFVPGVVDAPISLRAVAGQGDEIVVDLEIAGVVIGQIETAGGLFTAIDILGCGRTRAVGKALLPVVRRAIEIPQGAVPEIEIIQWETECFDLAALGLPGQVYPAQPPVEKTAGAIEGAEFVISEEFYNSSGWYPEVEVRLADTGQLRGHRFAVIEIGAARYRPQVAAVEVVRRARLRLRLSGGDHVATQQTIDRYANGHFEAAASRMLVNYRAPSGGAVPDLPTGYLIITAPDYVGAIQPLVDWKTGKGYQVTVTSTSDIPGDADTTGIRAYIRDAWVNWAVPPSFVLLVGDVDVIPNWVGLGANHPPTDLYYSTMTSPDYIPDIGIGRFSVSDSLQAGALAGKVVDYENLNLSDTAWLERAVFMASQDNYAISEGTHDYVIETYMDPQGYLCDKLYCHTYGAVPQQISDAFNAGRGLGIYSGHGDVDRWVDGPYFSQGDVNALTNLDQYPFIQSYACLTGKYTRDECFAETWIRAVNKGALAFYASSVTSLWQEDDVLEKGTFRALFVDGLTWLSGMTDQGKWYFYERYGDDDWTRRYFEQYNRFGDPSVDIWTDVPLAMTVEHAGICPLGDTSYALQVESYGVPVEDALVCMRMPGEVFETAYTGSDGGATLILDPAPAGLGEMILTVTHHNLIPAVDTVYVIVPPQVTISPDTIPVQTPTAVSVTVRDSLALPLEGVVVRVDGWGIEPALTDTTDALGEALITVDAPYGEILTVTGRQIGAGYNCFAETLSVSGALTLPGATIEATVDEIGVTGALALGWEGTITGFAARSGLDMFVVDCGIDTSASSAVDTVITGVEPANLGRVTVVLASPGCEIHAGYVPVLEAYGMLTGTVVDASTGDSLPDVAIAAYTAGADTSLEDPVFETVTGVDGTYSSGDSIAAGWYDVYAGKFAYLDLAESTTVRWGGNTLDFTLVPAPSGMVSGTVTEETTGRPISAIIEVYRGDDLSLHSQTASDSLSGGAYSTEAMPYFTYIFKLDAIGYMDKEVSVVVDDSSEVVDFEMVPAPASILVVDDNSSGFKAEAGIAWAPMTGAPAVGEIDTGKAVDSAPIIIQDLTDLGYDVDTETAAQTDPARWSYYDLVIWSCSGNYNPVADVTYRYNLNTYTGGGGRLLVEGGGIGHDSASDPGYPNFADSTLHVENWTDDFSGDLLLAAPDHPIATTPNLLPDTLAMQAFGFDDQDALVPDAETEIVFEWTSYRGEGGVLVYDDNPDSAACQIVFFSFDYANVSDTDGRKALLENAVVGLLAPEPTAEGEISGNVELYGWPSHAGTVVCTHPMGLSDTTDASGNYHIAGLFDGTYQVCASMAGFGDSTVTVVIAGGAAAEHVDFTLYRALEYTDTTDVPIPNNDPAGMHVYIDIPVNAEIASVDCYLDIAHPYRGDLIAELTSPGGTTVRLHDRSGGSANNIVTWYDCVTEPDGPGSMSDFAGAWSQGQWDLWLSDNAYLNIGTLRAWGLKIVSPPATSGNLTDSGIPRRHFVTYNYPNPFGPVTSLKFGLPRDEHVEICIYNVLGQRIETIASGWYPAGIHALRWDGTDSMGKPVASGIYFCRFRAGDFRANRVMALTR